jgi:hypothetical protein
MKVFEVNGTLGEVEQECGALNMKTYAVFNVSSDTKSV